MAIIIRRRKLGMSSAKGISQFSKTGIKWVRNDKPLPKDDLYIRWGCTSNVPTSNVLNTAKAIHEVNNKREFRYTLNMRGLCPLSWFNIVDFLNDNDSQDRNINFPMVIRKARHAQGKGLWLCQNSKEVQERVDQLGEGNFYISEYIPKVAEYRVAIVQGRAVWVVQKTPGNPEDIAWNVAEGGRFDNVRWNDWPLRVVRIAIEAFNLSSLNFGGVDVMVNEEGKAYILEINSAPSLTSPYRQECFAKAFDYIVNNGKQHIPLIEGKGGYTKFIHPAIEPKAKLTEEYINLYHS